MHWVVLVQETSQVATDIDIHSISPGPVGPGSVSALVRSPSTPPTARQDDNPANQYCNKQGNPVAFISVSHPDGLVGRGVVVVPNETLPQA